eukprot:436014-Pyramimonas_sp.AAC.1
MESEAGLCSLTRSELDTSTPAHTPASYSGFLYKRGGVPPRRGSTSPRRRVATGVGAPSARGGCPRR